MLVALGGVTAINQENANAANINTSHSKTAINNSTTTRSAAAVLQTEQSNDKPVSTKITSNGTNNTNTNVSAMTGKLYQNALQHGIDSVNNSNTDNLSSVSADNSKSVSLSYSANYSHIYNDYYSTSYDDTYGKRDKTRFSSAQIVKDLNNIQYAVSQIYHDFSINDQSAVSNTSNESSIANSDFNNIKNLSNSAIYNTHYSY